MKHLRYWFSAALLSAVLFAVNSCAVSSKALEAGVYAIRAVTITDAQIAELSRQAVAAMDAENTIAGADSPYDVRLRRLTAGVRQAGNLRFNYKVYVVPEVNAFACGDGSIRVYSALMDVMDDDELMAIIGHEIGHVMNTDVKDAMKNAYLTAAAVSALGATSENMARLSDSQLSQLAQVFVGAQYSQKQEFAADDQGFKFCVEQGRDPYGMANSLQKLVALSEGGATSSSVQKMFSSHPDSAVRAKRMRERADRYVAENRK